MVTSGKSATRKRLTTVSVHVSAIPEVRKVCARLMCCAVVGSLAAGVLELCNCLGFLILPSVL